MSLKSCIYQIVNIETKERYIGSTKNFNSRKASHLYDLRKNEHRNERLQKAYNLHGETCFAFLVLEYVQTNKERLFDREQLWIDLLNPEYNENRTAGNVIPRSARTKEAKEKISKSIKKLWKNPEYRERCLPKNNWKNGKSSNRLGAKLSDETKEKLRQANLGSNNPNWGKHRSKESRNKLAKTYIGAISPDGIIYSPITNLRDFCSKHSLDNGSMSRLLNGKINAYKGWIRCAE